MKNITLSDTECQIARYVGYLRNKLSMETKTNLRRDPLQDDKEMHQEAMGAELAVAKHLNVYPDLSPTDANNLPRFDLRWQGHRVEVKRRARQHRDLLIPNLDETVVYFLVYGRLPLFAIRGYIEGSKVTAKGRWEEMIYGGCWLVPAEELMDLKK